MKKYIDFLISHPQIVGYGIIIGITGLYILNFLQKPNLKNSNTDNEFIDYYDSYYDTDSGSYY